ncbi:hypothetical protein HW560_15580 [Paenibacillus sp. E222]|nr:hypothetical protein [Paenibacillus sp. E222]QLG39369.1 hypothetical protein HW560_15580 [Paenibacillus sp. E222]
MPNHQQLQRRISFLQQMQAADPETSSWFDESIKHLINEEFNKESD